VSSALGAFGIPGAPHWLQAISQFVGGISVGGSGSGGGAVPGVFAIPSSLRALAIRPASMPFVRRPAAARVARKPTSTSKPPASRTLSSSAQRLTERDRPHRSWRVLGRCRSQRSPSNRPTVTASSSPRRTTTTSTTTSSSTPTPKGMYDVGFTVRTQSGAFEIGGRAVDEDVPIREPILPFWLTPASRPRFQRLWGTPGNLQKVKCTWDGPSGPRWLILKLAKEISYTTEGGFDSDIDDVYHAVVSAHAYNPMYESPEEVQTWRNPPSKFTVTTCWQHAFHPDVRRDTYRRIAGTASRSAVQAAVENCQSVGKGTSPSPEHPATGRLAFYVTGTPPCDRGEVAG
jgi:hypothetical protein